MSEIKHWFCFSFQGKDAMRNECTACVYAGYETKEPHFPKSEIEHMKRGSGLGSGVLLGITYLGQMTREAFEGV